eukprot:8541289-Karenia_brevis.AAC.1
MPLVSGNQTAMRPSIRLLRKPHGNISPDSLKRRGGAWTTVKKMHMIIGNVLGNAVTMPMT